MRIWRRVRLHLRSIHKSIISILICMRIPLNISNDASLFSISIIPSFESLLFPPATTRFCNFCSIFGLKRNLFIRLTRCTDENFLPRKRKSFLSSTYNYLSSATANGVDLLLQSGSFLKLFRYISPICCTLRRNALLGRWKRLKHHKINSHLLRIHEVHLTRLMHSLFEHGANKAQIVREPNSVAIK